MFAATIDNDMRISSLGDTYLLSSPGNDGGLARHEVAASERGVPTCCRLGDRSHRAGYAADRAIQSRPKQPANLGVALGVN